MNLKGVKIALTKAKKEKKVAVQKIQNNEERNFQVYGQKEEPVSC